MKQNENRAIIALLFVGVLMGAVDISIVGPALPSIEEALQINTRFSGWIFSIYVLFNLIGISLFARLSDIYGRRKIYVLALAIFAAGSLWVSLSESFSFLLAGRAVQGFGASGIFPVAAALVGDLYPPEKRGRILGLIGAVFGIAFLIGPFVAGVLLHYFAWNFLFIINLPVAAVLIYYSLKLLPSAAVISVNRIDWGGIVALGITLAALTFGLNNIDASDWRSDLTNFRVVFPFALFLVSALVLLTIEKHVKNPIIKFSFFHNSQIIIVGILAIATGILQACFVFIPKFVVQNFSVAASTASFMLTPFVLATAVGSPVFGRLIDRFGVRVIIITGLALGAAGFYMLSLTGDSREVYYMSGIVIGLCLSVLAGSSLRYVMLNNTAVEDRAITQGMLTIFISIGQLTGTAVIGSLLASGNAKNDFRIIFISIAVILFALGFLALRLQDTERQKQVKN